MSGAISATVERNDGAAAVVGVVPVDGAAAGRPVDVGCAVDVGRAVVVVVTTADAAVVGIVVVVACRGRDVVERDAV